VPGLTDAQLDQVMRTARPKSSKRSAVEECGAKQQRSESAEKLRRKLRRSI